MKALIDASFLMLMANIGKDLLTLAEEALKDKIEAYILQDTLEELKNIAAKKGKKGMEASTALKLASNMKPIESNFKAPDIDRKLAKVAHNLNYVVITADMGLRKVAVKMGGKVIYFRRDGNIVKDF